MTRPNASYSRTFLTRENYRGPRLLRCIRAEESDKQSLMPTMQTDVREDENLIYAPPESSSSDDSEDGDPLPPEPAPKPRTSPPITSLKPSSPATKRAARNAASTKAKRRKLQKGPALDGLEILENPPPADPFLEWTSSGSQKTKPSKNYANRKFFQRLEPIESRTAPGAKENGIVSYKEVTSETTFVQFAQVPAPGAANGNIKSEQKTSLPSPPSERSDPKTAQSRIPDLPVFSSSGSIDKLVSSDGDSPRREGRSRSVSSSSLSSVDDLFLLLHNDEFGLQSESRSVGVRCPVCEKPVCDSISVFVPDNLRTLPFKQQQKFCSQHRLADAQGQWDERGYPKVDWEKLETSRIPNKTQQLKRVISRQRASYYRDELDAKIKAARGNRRAIRNYLNEGLSDVAKPGYYGPKGTRIMVHAITELLSQTLNLASRTDPAMRAAGVGAYVSAVLVPELTLLLVMEDMKLRTGKDGRRVLDESSDIGLLLNPDDDHVRWEHDGETEREP